MLQWNLEQIKLKSGPELPEVVGGGGERATSLITPALNQLNIILLNNHIS